MEDDIPFQSGIFVKFHVNFPAWNTHITVYFISSISPNNQGLFVQCSNWSLLHWRVDQPVSSHEKLKMKINNGNNLSMGTLPETNIAPENGWLEYYFPFLGWHIFRCYVSFRECKIKINMSKKGSTSRSGKQKFLVIPTSPNQDVDRCSGLIRCRSLQSEMGKPTWFCWELGDDPS